MVWEGKQHNNKRQQQQKANLSHKTWAWVTPGFQGVKGCGNNLCAQHPTTTTRTAASRAKRQSKNIYIYFFLYFSLYFLHKHRSEKKYKDHTHMATYMYICVQGDYIVWPLSWPKQWKAFSWNLNGTILINWIQICGIFNCKRNGIFNF